VYTTVYGKIRKSKVKMGGERITRTTLQNGILVQLAVVSVHEDRACLHLFNGGGARNSSTTRYFVPAGAFPHVLRWLPRKFFFSW
jgi:hypothetical protein